MQNGCITAKATKLAKQQNHVLRSMYGYIDSSSKDSDDPSSAADATQRATTALVTGKAKGWRGSVNMLGPVRLFSFTFLDICLFVRLNL